MKVVKEGSIYFGASVFEQAIPFILMPFLTRLFSTEEYGIISIFMALIAIYELIIGGSFSGFARVAYHKVKQEEFIQLVGNIHTLAMILMLTVIGLTVVFHPLIEKITNLHSGLLISVIIIALAKYLLSLRLVIYQTARKPLQYAILQISRPTIDLFLVVFLVFYMSGGINERLDSLVISASIAALIALVLLQKDGLFHFKFNHSQAKRVIDFVVPLIPHSIALTMIFTVDKIIISSGAGLSLVGELAVALSVASPTLIITESINKAFMPWSFEKFRKNKLEQVVGASYLILLIMTLICIAYSFILYVSFDLIVGESFKEALSPALALIWVGWLKLAYYLVIKGVVYSEKTKLIPFISVSAGVVYISLLLFNMKNIQLMDIVVYMLFFNLIMFIGIFILSQISYPQPWKNTKLLKNTILQIKQDINGY